MEENLLTIQSFKNVPTFSPICFQKLIKKEVTNVYKDNKARRLSQSFSEQKHRQQPSRIFPPRNSPDKKYWNGLQFPLPGDLPDLGIEPVSPASAGVFFTTEPPGNPYSTTITNHSTEKQLDS